LPTPDAIFIGGGGSESGVIDRAISALRPGGRLVANGVTLEMEAVLLSHHARTGWFADPHRCRAGEPRRQHDWLAAGYAGDAMVLDQARIET
jgi:precorrin-6B methylase 2